MAKTVKLVGKITKRNGKVVEQTVRGERYDALCIGRIGS